MQASLVLGIIALVLGLGLRYWVKRRRFNRKNNTQAKEFKNYESASAIKFIERGGKVAAYLLIILGLLFLWSYSRQKNAKEKSTQNTEIQKPQ